MLLGVTSFPIPVQNPYFFLSGALEALTIIETSEYDASAVEVLCAGLDCNRYTNFGEWHNMT